ncbi:MAG: hypothetical protein HYV63_34775 [Candidatus Schekmanbacteria bacterium]|nr:hypothetical protein [Candidatus Schekmanbacteria bacterium]
MLARPWLVRASSLTPRASVGAKAKVCESALRASVPESTGTNGPSGAAAATRISKSFTASALPKSRQLQNYHRIVTWLPRALVLTECPRSVMRLVGLRIPAVALLGTHLSPEQGSIRARVPTLILLLDGDAASSRSVARLIADRFSPTARAVDPSPQRR